MSDVTRFEQSEALPDLPGKVHGVKSLNPFVVQCDDCLATFSHEVNVIAVHQTIFNARSDVPHRRLCADCWRERGWIDSSARGWQQTSQR